MTEFHPDTLIRLAMLWASRRPITTSELTEAVTGLQEWRLNNRQTATMAARLHRAGWLTYDYEGENVSRHVVTDAGREVLALIRVGVFDA